MQRSNAQVLSGKKRWPTERDEDLEGDSTSEEDLMLEDMGELDAVIEDLRGLAKSLKELLEVHKSCQIKPSKN